MNTRSSPDRYYPSAAEAAEELGLPLLGELAAEFRIPRVTEGLAGLAPDPRFAERVYRFLGGDATRIWIVGLGQGGEELPVVVGIAEAAAVAGHAPVLIVRPGETPPAGLGGRPLEAEAHAAEIAALFPHGGMAQPAGVEGVFLGWPGRVIGAGPCDPATLLVATGDREERPPLPAAQVDATVLVVPWRDLPAEWIAARVASLREAGYALTGCVAWAGREAAAETPEPTGGVQRRTANRKTPRSEVRARKRAARAGAAAPQAGEATPPAGETPVQEGAAITHAETTASPATLKASRPAQREEIPVRAEWARTFGPRSRRRGRGEGTMRRIAEPRKGIPLFWWLIAAIAILIMAGVIFPKVFLPGSGRDGAQLEAPVTGAAPGSAAEQVGEDAAAVMPAEEILPDAATQGSESAREDEQISGTASEADAREVDEAAAIVPETEPSAASPTAAARATAAREPAQSETPARDAVSTDLVAEARGPFAVLCGSYSRADRAAGEVRRLSAAGEEARLVTVSISQRGIWNRVIVGHFDGQAAAQREARRMVASGLVASAQVISAGGSGRTVAPPVTESAR